MNEVAIPNPTQNPPASKQKPEPFVPDRRTRALPELLSRYGDFKPDNTQQGFSSNNAAFLGALSGLVTYDINGKGLLGKVVQNNGLLEHGVKVDVYDEKANKQEDGFFLSSNREQVVILFPGSATYNTQSWQQNFDMAQTDAPSGKGKIHQGYHQALYGNSKHSTAYSMMEKLGPVGFQEKLNIEKHTDEKPVDAAPKPLLDTLFKQLKAADERLLTQGMSQQDLDKRPIYLAGESQGGVWALITAADPRFEPIPCCGNNLAIISDANIIPEPINHITGCAAIGIGCFDRTAISDG